MLALTIDNEEGTNWEPAGLGVHHRILGATGTPGSVTISRWRRLDDVVRELLGGREITHVVSVPEFAGAAPPSSRRSRRLSGAQHRNWTLRYE